MEHYDVVVLGTGGVGSAAAYHAALRGAKVLGLDRFTPAHDRGSSHGATRIIRQAYYEHPDYVPLAERAFKAWAELEARCGERLYHQTGLLEVGPSDGEVLAGVRASARMHDLDIEELPAGQVMARWPGFAVPDDLAGVFEPRAGFLRVEECVLAHQEEARRLGARLESETAVESWRAEGRGVRVVAGRPVSAAALIITAGAWAASVLADLGLPLLVRRKSVFWYRQRGEQYSAAAGCPCYLFELPQGIFYGVPSIDGWGVKAAEHSGGASVEDPLAVSRQVDPVEQRRVEDFLAAHLPQAVPPFSRHSVCMYTMTPDSHFIVDRHPAWPQVVFAAGLSGHGFKFTGVLGQALVELALDGKTSLPVAFLACGRPALRSG
ncbi:MAG: N-methyl-L-tryptophan oxidase [Pirellulales bacterium]